MNKQLVAIVIASVLLLFTLAGCQEPPSAEESANLVSNSCANRDVEAVTPNTRDNDKLINERLLILLVIFFILAYFLQA